MANMQMNLNEEASLLHKHISLLGKEIYLYREISSTNSIARHMALSGAPEGTIVMSKSQTVTEVFSIKRTLQS
jgi:BirA family biotin operon repressor/biotin-[acetyl-CoA-carboxylase] ligase